MRASKYFLFFFCTISIVVIINSCSKGGGGGTTPPPPPPNPCSGITVSVTATITNATSGQSNGSITASATGGSGFTFSINNGTFQSSGTFNNLAAGTYTITAKNSNNCTGSAQFTVASSGTGACSGTAGPLFTAVKAVVQTNCAVSGCHDAQTAQNGINFSLDCTIVEQGASIKARAVDQAGTGTQMPPPPRAALSAADRQKITDWLAAGGRFTN
ncbi:MAG TPA: hypothetical protein VNA26_04575 [Chitinophagaceae bacterium]|nr:hypothetical protein [Chitinophagaceae bacterium]